MAVTPIDTSDGTMPAVGSDGRIPNGGYGPSASPTTQLGVYAATNVTAAPTQAQRLAQALNVAWDQAEPSVLKKVRLQGAADEARGSADAETDNVDPALAAVNSGYRVGATRVNAQKHALQAISSFQQQANDPQNPLYNIPLFDSADGAQDGLLSKADQYFRQQLGGLEKDAVSAKAITPMISHFMNELAGERVQRQVTDTRNQALNNAVSQATLDLQNGGQTFDYSEQYDTLKKLFGGDGVSANKALSQAIIDSAYTQHSLKMLDLIPKTITDANGNSAAGPAMAPETEQKLNEARNAITRLVDQDNEQARANTRFSTFKTYDDLLDKGIPVPLARLKQDMNSTVAGKPLISQEEANSYYRKGQELGGSIDRTNQAAAAMAKAPWYTLVGTYPGNDPSNGKPFAKEDFEHVASLQIGQAPVEQRPSIAAQMTKSTGLVYEPLQSTLSNEPLNTVQGVKDVLGAYQAMGSSDQTVLGAYFSNPERRAQVDAMLGLRKANWSDDKIADYMTQVDPKQAREDYQQFRAKDVNNIIGDMKVNDARMFGKVRLSDLANGGEAVARLQQLATTIGQTGLYSDPQAIARQAQQQLLDSSYLIDIGKGHSILMPRTPSDPPAEVSQQALQWFYDSKLPDIAKKSGYAGDTSDVVLAPHPFQDGVLGLFDHTGYPINHDRYTMNDIVSGYEKSRQAAIAQSSAESQKQREQAAAAPVNWGMSP